MACCRTKAAISETRKELKIEEKLLRTAYRNSPTLFRTVPSRPPTASPSPKLGVRNPTSHPKLQSKIAGKRVLIVWNSLYGRHIRFFLWGIESGHSQGRPQISGLPPINSGMGKSTDFKFGRYILRMHLN